MTDLIFIEETPMQGKERPFQPDAVIGREGAEIVLADPEISRRHARLKLVEGAPAIEDLGSTNGTLVNGERITGVRVLIAGDMVQLGGTTWRVGEPTGATQVAAAAAPPAAAPQEPAAAQPAAAAAQPAAAAAQPAAAGDGVRRGDVPQPDASPPSAVRRALPAVPAHVFQPPAGGSAPRGGSAARRVTANIYSLAMTAAAAAGVIVFLIAER
jgi:predicted component of type VI protein secretion system